MDRLLCRIIESWVSRSGKSYLNVSVALCANTLSPIAWDDHLVESACIFLLAIYLLLGNRCDYRVGTVTSRVL